MSEVKPGKSQVDMRDKEVNSTISEIKADVEKPLPTLLEVTFTISRMVVVITGVLTAGICYLYCADIFAAVLRGGAAVLALGFLAWLINWLIVHFALENGLADLQARRDEAGLHTVERTV